MFFNYLIIAARNFIKNRTFSVINIVGLAIGMACSILIILFIRDELSYDRHYEHYNELYRVATMGKFGPDYINHAQSSVPIGPTLVEELPAFKDFTRLWGGWNMSIGTDEKSFNEEGFFFADTSVFDMFSIQFITGDPKTALTRPLSAVMTESAAEKYFGDDNPIGKKIKGENNAEFEIAGIIEDAPLNSHFHYNILASFNSLQYRSIDIFVNMEVHTYVLTDKKYDYKNFSQDVEPIIEKYIGPQIFQYEGVSLEEFYKAGNDFRYFLQPVKDIHLHSHLDGEIEANSNIRYVYIFTIIAAIVLLIACINFMNLATARSSTRSKEVGIRKTIGATRRQLILQFVGESVLMAFLAHIIAMIMVECLLPQFNNLTGKQLAIDYSDFRWILGLLMIIVITGLLAGAYPAFLLSSFKPMLVLKSFIQSGSGRSILRNGLVVFQFTLSIAIILATILVYRQLNYMNNKELGYNPEQLLVIQKAYGLLPHHETFKEELLKNNNIISATICAAVAGNIHSAGTFYAENGTREDTRIFNYCTADNDFLKTFELKLADGRYFSDEFADENSVVVNEAGVKALGLKDPVGKRMYFVGGRNDQPLQIIGVVKDYHYESLHQEINPLIIAKGNFNSIVVRIKADDINKSIAIIEKLWKKYSDKAFDYYFLDDKFRDLYFSEIRTAKVLGIFSFLAIIIACLGLFGIVTYTTEQRTKEIGIRKVMGASAGLIVSLISKQIISLILLANIVAWPVAYFWMKNWLQDFAYRTDIQIWYFFVTFAFSLLIAISTVAHQSIRSARKNPVMSLRYE